MEPVSTSETLAAITEHRTRLRTMLGGFETATLAMRPPSGDWSAIENVGHLVATAQHHLGPFVPGGLGWSPLGVPQGRRAKTIAPRDVAAVLEEWDRVHVAACRGLDLTSPDMAVEVPARGVRVLSLQLGAVLRHQQQHGRQAARALSQVTGQIVRVPPRYPEADRLTTPRSLSVRSMTAIGGSQATPTRARTSSAISAGLRSPANTVTSAN